MSWRCDTSLQSPRYARNRAFPVGGAMKGRPQPIRARGAVTIVRAPSRFDPRAWCHCGIGKDRKSSESVGPNKRPPLLRRFRHKTKLSAWTFATCCQVFVYCFNLFSLPCASHSLLRGSTALGSLIKAVLFLFILSWHNNNNKLQLTNQNCS